MQQIWQVLKLFIFNYQIQQQPLYQLLILGICSSGNRTAGMQACVTDRANSLLMMPQVLLSPCRQAVASTNSYYIASLIPRLLCRQLAYGSSQLTHMYVTLCTRNTHAHLCLAPVRRLRTRVINADAGEACVARVTFANLLQKLSGVVVSKP